MRRAKVEEVEPKTDLTPMIDVVFNLLIFFLCAARLRADEGVIRAHLPKGLGTATGTPLQPLNDVRVKLLWVDEQVVVSIGAQRFNAPGELPASAGPAHPVWRALHERLVAFKAAASDPAKLSVILDARAQVPTQFVVSALNEVVRAEVREVRFAAPENPF